MCSVTSNATADKIELSAFEVRSIQAAKSKSSSCPRKIPSRELWPICQALLASTYKICLVSEHHVSRTQGVKTLPGMHCDHVVRTFLELGTRLTFCCSLSEILPSCVNVKSTFHCFLSEINILAVTHQREINILTYLGLKSTFLSL